MTKRDRDKPPQPDDDAIFRASVSDVTPLPSRNQARLQRPPVKPIPEQRLRDERETLKDSLSDHNAWEAGHETGDELNFLRPGMAPHTLRQLRRGHWVIQDEIDLHGLTTAQARPLLVEFLNDCRRAGVRCVRIVHGKGLRSKNREPVLKGKVAGWLMQRDEVLAFCQARPTEGGGGAVIVLLRGAK